MDSIGWLFVTSREEDAPEMARLIGQIAATPAGLVPRGWHRIRDEDPDRWAFGGVSLACLGESATPRDGAVRNLRGVWLAGLASLLHRFLRRDSAAATRLR